jgi:hypothetical protein
MTTNTEDVARKMQRDVAEEFKKQTADHKMTVLHDDGLYRHLRFRTPKHGFYWFDLITWPGTLAFRGDMDGHMFTRVTDMFEFFRDNGQGINPHYWSEKVEGGRDETRSFSQEKFKQCVIEQFVEAVRYGNAPRGLGKAVREEILDDPETYYEQGAHAAIDSFEYKGFRFSDWWELDFREFDWQFLWACHAIQWGIAQYDAKRAGETSGAAA